MVKKGFVVVGFVTDGEWNLIRTQGSSRPVSVIQLLMNARKESTSTNINTIKRYFELIPGTQQPRLPHPSIPLNDILFFDTLCQQANPRAVIPVDHAIFVFRSAMFFPFQYNPYPWTSNINEESPTDCFKSVFAQCLYIHKINTFAAPHQVSISLRMDTAQKNVRKQRNFFMKERIMAIS